MYISDPFLVAPGEAAANFVMGRVRFWHGVTSYVFTINLIVRLYWFWAGNEYSKMTIWKKTFWKDMLKTIRYYLFFKQEHTGHLGHNSLAQISYFIFIWLGSAVMILTGFAMRVGTDQSGFLGTLFAWVIPFFNNENAVRMLHHLIAWGYAVFLAVHLYLVFRQDILDDDGTVSSIVNGYKYELPSNVKVEESSAKEFIPDSK